MIRIRDESMTWRSESDQTEIVGSCGGGEGLHGFVATGECARGAAGMVQPHRRHLDGRGRKSLWDHRGGQGWNMAAIGLRKGTDQTDRVRTSITWWWKKCCWNTEEAEEEDDPLEVVELEEVVVVAGVADPFWRCWCSGGAPPSSSAAGCKGGDTSMPEGLLSIGGRRKRKGERGGRTADGDEDGEDGQWGAIRKDWRRGKRRRMGRERRRGGGESWWGRKGRRRRTPSQSQSSSSLSPSTHPSVCSRRTQMEERGRKGLKGRGNEEGWKGGEGKSGI